MQVTPREIKILCKVRGTFCPDEFDLEESSALWRDYIKGMGYAVIVMEHPTVRNPATGTVFRTDENPTKIYFSHRANYDTSGTARQPLTITQPLWLKRRMHALFLEHDDGPGSQWMLVMEQIEPKA
jgi:hypothetical protein